MARIKSRDARNVAVGYLRVSTPGQAAEGVSLEAQEGSARTWAASHGYDLAAVHSDAGLSGKRYDNRPGLKAALDEVCKARGTLVVYSLSRMARSVKDTLAIAERLEKCGADLVSLSESIDTTGASGRMVFKVLAVLAEFERDLASERTRAALAHKRAKGEKTGGSVPFGYKDRGPGGGVLVEHPGEQRTIAYVRKLRAKGLTLRAIAERLNGAGDRQKKGSPWTRQAISRTLAHHDRRRLAMARA
jgi:site-specific DNA recombinase